MQSILSLKPESLTYKKRSLNVDMFTYPTSTHIYFIFESKADAEVAYGLRFSIKGLQMENTDDEKLRKFRLNPGEKQVRAMKRTEERGQYCFKVTLK